MRGLPRGGRAFGAALVGIGLMALYSAISLPVGNLREPGAGFFPIVVAVALILFAALTINRKTSDAEQKSDPSAVARVWILTAMLAAYGWLLPSVGFVLCTIALLGLLLRGFEVDWPATIIGAGGGAVGCYFLFTRLGMPLPSGLLGF